MTTTKTYRIENTKSGVVLGEYEGATEAEALDALARDAGYKSRADQEAQIGGSADDLALTEVEAGAKEETLRDLVDSDTNERIGYATQEQADASDAAGPEGHIRIHEDGHVVDWGGRRVYVEAE